MVVVKSCNSLCRLLAGFCLWLAGIIVYLDSVTVLASDTVNKCLPDSVMTLQEVRSISCDSKTECRRYGKTVKYKGALYECTDNASHRCIQSPAEPLSGFSYRGECLPLHDSVAPVLQDSGQISFLQAYTAYLEVALENLSGVHVGLMISNKENGATILSGYKLLLENDTNHTRQTLIETLLAMPDIENVDDGHSFKAVSAFYELYRYLNGLEYINHDKTGDNFGVSGSPRAAGLPDYDPQIIDGNYFVSPFENIDVNTDACINLSALVMKTGDKTSEINPDSPVVDVPGLDEFEHFEQLLQHISSRETDVLDNGLREGLQNMRTWVMTDKDREYVTRWAAAGNTNTPPLLIEHGWQFEKRLLNVFQQVVSPSSSLTAASAPVNVFNETRSLNDLFIAVFQANNGQRWSGNIKKLSLHDVNGKGDIRVLDVLNRQSLLEDPQAQWTEAIDPLTGRISSDALTFWTDKDHLSRHEKKRQVRDGYYVERGGVGQKIPGFREGVISFVNRPDSRQLYIESGTAASGVVPLNASDALADELYTLFESGIDTWSYLENVVAGRALDNTEISKLLIQYIRGADLLHDAFDVNAASSPPRQWILGDVIHSKPLALNYGHLSRGEDTWYREDNPYISVIFGSNDGLLRFVENTGPDPVDEGVQAEQTGVERFAFMPRELLKIIPELVRNDGFYNNPHGTNSHPYGMDNEVSALVFDDIGNPNNNYRTIDHPATTGCEDCRDFAYLYASMRRGGKRIYHLDVTNPFVAPKMLGKITRTEKGDFDELGLTFSRPVPVLMRDKQQVKPVLVFAGGYDNNAYDDYPSQDPYKHYNHFNAFDRAYPEYHYVDENGNARTATVEGNAIYIVDAKDLSLIWKATYGDTKGAVNNSQYTHPDMKYSIPSNIAPFDSNGDGIVDMFYVGDVAGNIWRGDFPQCRKEQCADPNWRQKNWSVSKLASLSETDKECGQADMACDEKILKGRGDIRFFHAPAIVPMKEYNGIVIGSGDRANPGGKRTVNRIFMIRDEHKLPGNFSGNAIVASQLADVTDCVTELNENCDKLNKGWQVRLEAGEKIFSTPLVADGQIFVSSYRPKVTGHSACEPTLGESFLYLLDFKDGTAANDNSGRSERMATGMSGDVTVVADTIILPGSVSYDFLYAKDSLAELPSDGEPDKGATSVKPSGSGGVYIEYWREQNRDLIE